MKEFFKGKRVFITGHTGFKGSWLLKILINSGAIIRGYALEPNTTPNLFTLANLSSQMDSIIGDIRDLEKLKKAFLDFKPEIAIHLAAQPLVRESYLDPHYTYETNVMGTVNFLECVRASDTVKSVLNVTTDKVYFNIEQDYGYRETDVLNGYDPYSNSKSCSELVTDSYKRSFFQNRKVAISTARAGNVIGGGDFSLDRIIPDCVKAAERNTPIIIRNPYSIRPYQHVIEPLYAYLLIVYKQYIFHTFSGSYNVGPDDKDCVETSKLVDLFCESWKEGLTWINQHDGGPHEANFLKLDSTKIKNTLGWTPLWNIEEAIKKTVEWTKVYVHQGDIKKIMDSQIESYEKKINRLFQGENI
ncbi:MAG: CDP-glucose 4,6-dehydratase [Acholeplasmataceae bacterium]|nr:CDP-glucose 4,6-dehydratase [Acholeplasmataceae bacterium]